MESLNEREAVVLNKLLSDGAPENVNYVGLKKENTYNPQQAEHIELLK